MICFQKMIIFCHAASCRLVMPYFAPCAEMWNTSWFVPDGSRGSSGCLRSLSVWVVMDAPLGTRLRSYRISLGCMGGCCWGRNSSHLGNHTNCDHAWRLLGRKSSFSPWWFFPSFFRWSVFSSKGHGDGNFQFPTHRLRRMQRWHVPSDLYGSNAHQYLGVNEEMLQWKTCLKCTEEIPFPQQPKLGGNKGQRQAR